MQIGDYYNKEGQTGIVISVDASGQHGLLMCLRSYFECVRAVHRF